LLLARSFADVMGKQVTQLVESSETALFKALDALKV
jgi:hypothetical protein